MKTDESLQKDVQDVIQWETLLESKKIDVTVTAGIVTLNGTVDSYDNRTEAEKAVENVGGIKGVVDNLRIRKDHPVQKQKSGSSK